MNRPALTALAVVLVLAATRAGAGGDPQEDAKKALADLQGTWRLTAVENQGRTNDLADDGPRWLIKGNKVFYAGKELAVLTADGATKPKSLDLAFAEPKRSYEGIYSVKDDELKICVNRNTEGVKERPTDFATEGKPDLRVLVFRRDKGSATEGLRGFVGIRIKVGSDEKEVVIDGALPNSPAEKAGLKQNDILLKVGSREATGIKQVVDMIREIKPNTEITLRVRRDDKERDVTVKVGVMPFMYLD
jgi:uncharacterized protein (TIGR03067 family)